MNNPEDHVTDGGQCWCFPDFNEKDMSITIHHSARQLADMRRDDAVRFRKVAQRGLKHPEMAQECLSWLHMQCHNFILGED